MYSSLFGVDSELKQLKHGFDAVFTGYAGYTGSHQTYDGVSIYQNGGLIGGTAVFYKITSSAELQLMSAQCRAKPPLCSAAMKLTCSRPVQL